MFGISGEAQNSWTGLLEKESGVQSSTGPQRKVTNISITDTLFLSVEMKSHQNDFL